MEDHQWRGVVTAMGSPPWAERFATVQARIEAPEEIDRRVAEWSRAPNEARGGDRAAGERRPRRMAVLLASGDPRVAAARPPAGLRDARPRGRSRCNHRRPPLRRRRGWRPHRPSAGVAVPWEACGSSRPAGCWRSRSPAPFWQPRGVVNKSLQDLPRLDMYRRRGPYVDGEAGPERSAYFALMNHSKGASPSMSMPIVPGSTPCSSRPMSHREPRAKAGHRAGHGSIRCARHAPGPPGGQLIGVRSGRTPRQLSGVRVQPPGVGGAWIPHPQP